MRAIYLKHGRFKNVLKLRLTTNRHLWVDWDKIGIWIDRAGQRSDRVDNFKRDQI